MKKVLIIAISVILSLCIIFSVVGFFFYLRAGSLTRSVIALKEANSYVYLVGGAYNPSGAQGKDLSKDKYDFSGLKREEFAFFSFDTKTIWPGKEKMPKGYLPDDILNRGMNPGLGIRKLHSQHIDGSGISVAVIDKPILAEHDEFRGRIKYIEVLPDDTEAKRLHFHGMACASILAGENCGVANKATLYYFAVPDNGQNILNYTEALQQLLAVNSKLAEKDKIKVVSISDGGWYANNNDASRKLTKMISRVEAAGVTVVDCAQCQVDFIMTGCPVSKDPDNIDNYEIGVMHQSNYKAKDLNVFMRFIQNLNFTRFAQKYIFVPSDYRTTASNSGVHDFAYWGQGGRSWSCPYLAGVIALGKQVNSKISDKELFNMINTTATKSKNGLQVINPEKFIQKIKAYGNQS